MTIHVTRMGCEHVFLGLRCVVLCCVAFGNRQRAWCSAGRYADRVGGMMMMMICLSRGASINKQSPPFRTIICIRGLGIRAQARFQIPSESHAVRYAAERYGKVR